MKDYEAHAQMKAGVRNQECRDAWAKHNAKPRNFIGIRQFAIGVALILTIAAILGAIL